MKCKQFTKNILQSPFAHSGVAFLIDFEVLYDDLVPRVESFQLLVGGLVEEFCLCEIVFALGAFLLKKIKKSKVDEGVDGSRLSKVSKLQLPRNQNRLSRNYDSR